MVLPFEHIEFTKTFGRKYNSSKNILTNKIENLFICHKLNTINQSRDRENFLETEKYTIVIEWTSLVKNWKTQILKKTLSPKDMIFPETLR